MSLLIHETLTLGVLQDATLTAAALRDEAAGAVDPRRVELNKLEVLAGDARADRHGVAIARAGVRGRGGEPGAAVAAGCEDCRVGLEAVDGSWRTRASNLSETLIRGSYMVVWNAWW